MANTYPRTLIYNDDAWWNKVKLQKGNLHVVTCAFGKATLDDWAAQDIHMYRGYTVVDVRDLPTPGQKKLAEHDGRHVAYVKKMARADSFIPYARFMLDVIRRVQTGATSRICFGCDTGRYQSTSAAILF